MISSMKYFQRKIGENKVETELSVKPIIADEVIDFFRLRYVAVTPINGNH